MSDPSSLLTPFTEAIAELGNLAGVKRDKAIWNAALRWASENAYLEVIDEFTNEIVEPKLDSMDLMDEIYQVSQSSILQGTEPE